MLKWLELFSGYSKIFFFNNLGLKLWPVISLLALGFACKKKRDRSMELKFFAFPAASFSYICFSKKALMDRDIPYILMLEDDGDDRHITQMFFSEKGYNVGREFLTEAGDVLPYLERCLNENRLLPRLILLDKNIPSLSGLEVLAQIREHAVLRALPVVMISGSPNQKEINESYRLGVNSFITKPFGNELTAKTIDAFVNYWFGTVDLPEVAGVAMAGSW